MADERRWPPGRRATRKILLLAILASFVAVPFVTRQSDGPACVTARRLMNRPIIHPALDPSLTTNIQGPSLIRAPNWVKRRLGRYYLYFASHKGDGIRLAYADNLKGPWKIYRPGALPLANSLFPTTLTPTTANEQDMEGEKVHIASPDAHIDQKNRRIILYYHGVLAPGMQRTRAAVSEDGVHFHPRPELLGPSYFRVFRHGDYHYAMAMPGVFLRSRDGLSHFEKGPVLFDGDQRHGAVLKRGNILYIFWTRAGDAPERIYVSRVDISGDWTTWKAAAPEEILRPQYPWEGSDAPLTPSHRGTGFGHLNQLRDPAVLENNGNIYLLYAVAGESGIAIAQLKWNARACANRAG